MITCQKCGKENQDHYKFCLGCGAELARELVQKSIARGASPDAVQGYAEQGHERNYTERNYAEPATDAPPETAAAPMLGADATHASAGMQAPRIRQAFEPAQVPPTSAATNGASAYVNCPQCDHHNPTSNRFCASCGYKLNLSSVPAKPGLPSVPGVSGGVMLTALRADGSEAGSYTLPQGPSEIIGRDTGSIFAGDSYLSPRHAVFARKGDRLFVSDARSLNGVYLKIRPNTPWPLRFADIFRIGQEILRLEKLEGPQAAPDGVQRLGSPADGYVARLGLVIGRDTTGNAFPVPKSGLHLGRERGDVLFPEDGYVSGLHCRLGVGTDNSITLTDLGSSNGSFVRLRDEHQISSGDILLMGQQLFRIDA